MLQGGCTTEGLWGIDRGDIWAHEFNVSSLVSFSSLIISSYSFEGILMRIWGVGTLNRDVKHVCGPHENILEADVYEPTR